ncbi:Helix-turn-helix domain-containing protein [Lentzea albidocapillata subsp. violacea]|uniref:Helix-turn-helix domain-containing protein n=1 Tax=Lentzea albidocapillata subsp. violacea TaxID=128104 RepID=A0A1G9I5U3_9PSEU|nr:helix-turn-helix transcriptional regulator [Lentzea albidocapillata]SDL20618.1 Helix-turn-helix domain-containing protein [Lentzea albidocapillata subsp. violacea]
MSEPTFRQRRLGRALQLLRERARLSQKDIAERLRYNIAKVSRIENGQVPDYSAFETMLDVYGVIADDQEPYVEMWQLAEEKAWWHQYRLEDQGYISLEHDAAVILTFQASYVPGLLQTKRYMRALFASVRSPRSKKWVEDQIAIRTRRRQRLESDKPVRYHAIIMESALRHADREQLSYINEVAGLPTVTVQVIPDSVGLHEGYNGSFTLLDFPYPSDPRVLYVEHTEGSIHIEDPARVKSATLTFKHLSKLALIPEKSAALIGRLAAER